MAPKETAQITYNKFLNLCYSRIGAVESLWKWVALVVLTEKGILVAPFLAIFQSSIAFGLQTKKKKREKTREEGPRKGALVTTMCLRGHFIPV